MARGGRCGAGDKRLCQLASWVRACTAYHFIQRLHLRPITSCKGSIYLRSNIVNLTMHPSLMQNSDDSSGTQCFRVTRVPLPTSSRPGGEAMFFATSFSGGRVLRTSFPQLPHLFCSFSIHIRACLSWSTSLPSYSECTGTMCTGICLPAVLGVAWSLCDHVIRSECAICKCSA